MKMSQSLAGKLAVVTGASRGIGAAIALELASRGASVLVHYSSSEAAALQVAEQIRSSTGGQSQAWTVQADLSTLKCADAVMRKVDEIGMPIHALVLSGAVAYHKSIEDLDVESIQKEFTEQMNINVRSTILLVNAAIKRLANPSRIVILSSIAARSGTPLQTVYGASKASLEHCAKVWSKELGHKYGTTVNCVNPGPTQTDMWKGAPQAIDDGHRIEETAAAHRLGVPDDVAQIVAFLCEEGSRWVSGSTVNANGGHFPH